MAADVEGTIFDLLSTDSAGFAALVGDRLFPNFIPPHTTPLPWVAYAVTAADPVEGVSASTSARLEIGFDVVAETYAEVRAIFNALKTRLHGYRGGQVLRALWQNFQAQEVEEGYHAAVGFLVLGTEANVIPIPGTLARIVAGDGEILLQPDGSATALRVTTEGVYTDLVYYGDGSGLSGLPTPPPTTPGGSTTQVQFNDSGAFGGSSSFTFDDGTGTITVGGQVLTSASAAVFGRSHNVSGTDHLVAGVGCTATGTDGDVVVGYQCSATARVAFVLGRQSSSSGVNSIAVGNTVSVSNSMTAGVGIGVTVTANNACAFGLDVTVNHRAMAIGEQASTEAVGDVAVGNPAAPPFLKFQTNSSTQVRTYAGVRSVVVSSTDATRTGGLELTGVYAGTHYVGVRVQGDSSGAAKVGFFNVTPVARQTLPSAGSVTAADIRTALINLGLCQ